MMNMKGYFDLCIHESVFKSPDIEPAVKLLYDYGYRTIAVNQEIVDETDQGFEPKKKKKKGQPKHKDELVPKPFDVEVITKVAEKLGYDDFKVLTRLTISFYKQDFVYKVVKSPNYKLFDIVASQPASNMALMYTSTQFEADILTFNPVQRYNLRLTRKLYNHLVERGYYIELLYSPCILDSSRRKNMIHAAHIYHSHGKSKNVIFSSGTEHYRLIRSPYDIINMGLLFGLSDLKCRTSINEYPRKVILHSIGRRHGKAVMFVEHVEEKEEVKNGAMEVIEDVEEVNATIENGGIDVKDAGGEVECGEGPILKKPKVDGNVQKNNFHLL